MLQGEDQEDQERTGLRPYNKIKRKLACYCPGRKWISAVPTQSPGRKCDSAVPTQSRGRKWVSAVPTQTTGAGLSSTWSEPRTRDIQAVICQLVKQDAQLSQRDRAAGCVTVFAKSRRLELGYNILRTL